MKRSQHRMPMILNHQAYPSDLTDEHWKLLEPLVPALSAELTYHMYERHKIVNATLYVLCSGCSWRLLPHEFPAWGTVNYYFRKWQCEGIWDNCLKTLRMQVCKTQGQDAEPSAVRGPEKGYDPGEKSGIAKGTFSWIRKGIRWPSRSSVPTAPKSSEPRGCSSPKRQSFPTIKLLWGNSHHGRTFIGWLRWNVCWVMQTVYALTAPKRVCSCPKASKWSRTSSSPKDFARFPEDGWWSAASLGLCAGVGSVAIMRPAAKFRGLHHAIGQLSHTHQAGSCFPAIIRNQIHC